MKLSFYLCPTRVNLCVASESILPGQEERAADFLVHTLASSNFPFSVSSFRPGNLRLFGSFFNRMGSKKKEKFANFLAKLVNISHILTKY